MDMKRHMSMISSKIEVEIDINNDELLKPNGNIKKRERVDNIKFEYFLKCTNFI